MSSTPNSEMYEAALALLSLRGSYDWQGANNPEASDAEERPNVFLDCLIASEAPVVPNNNPPEPVANASTANYPVISTPMENDSDDIVEVEVMTNDEISEPHLQHDERYSKEDNSHIITNSTPKLSQLETKEEAAVINMTAGTSHTIEITTRDIGTQTEESRFNPVIELMENTIKQLCEKIRLLEFNKLKGTEVLPTNSEDEGDTGSVTQNKSQNTDSDMSMNEDTNRKCSKNKQNTASKNRNAESRKNKSQNNDGKKTLFANQSNNTPNSSDLVPIGNGHATVPGRILRHINWNSHTAATRKLLTAVFSRRTLATHSLTGKPSPAFPNKPAKKKLDSDLVNDIVQTVMERCSVVESIVRTSITTKCADESKMFRTRESRKKKRTTKIKCENVPPTGSESES